MNYVKLCEETLQRAFEADAIISISCAWRFIAASVPGVLAD